MAQQRQHSAFNAATSSAHGDNDYVTTTNHRIVTHPVESLVHQALRDAWMINSRLPMAYIFDSVCPARRWRRGMLFDEQADFPEYDPDYPKELTYTNGPPPGWMPFNVKPYR